MSERLPACVPCGAALHPESSFCHNCGSPIPVQAPVTAGKAEAITWETNIPLLTNPLVLKQMALAILGAGLLMGFILTVVLAAIGDYRDIPVTWLISLLVTAALGLLCFLVALIFFGNRVRVRFTVDSKGALWETVDKRARAGSRLAIIAGILGRSPQAAGAGVLAVSREQEFVRWKEVFLVEHNRRHLMITLRNSWRTVMMLVCLPGNFEQVAGFIHQQVGPAPAAAEAKPNRKPLLKGLGRTALVTAAALPLFMLSDYPFDLDIFLPLLLFLFALAMVWLVPLFGWVVIVCAAILVVQITWIALFEFSYLYDVEYAVLFLAYAGLAYLTWFSWRSLRGKIRPAIMEE